MSTTSSGQEQKPRWLLVTGGSRGIGRAIVERAAQAGRRVVFTYQRSADAANSLAAELSAQGGWVRAVECDGTHAEKVRVIVEALIAELGAPFALVNNAGITRDALLLNAKDAEIAEILATNLASAFYFSRAVLRSMIQERDGVILQISSVGGIKGTLGQTGYAATKAGLIGMMRSLALETARFDVRVNCVAPGYIDTDMVAQMPREAIAKQVPLRRMGKASEVAALVEFLMSPEAKYITGQTIVIDGGMSA